MIVTARKTGEGILVRTKNGEEIFITILKAGQKPRIGVNAPNCSVIRTEKNPVKTG